MSVEGTVHTLGSSEAAVESVVNNPTNTTFLFLMPGGEMHFSGKEMVIPIRVNKSKIFKPLTYAKNMTLYLTELVKKSQNYHHRPPPAITTEMQRAMLNVLRNFAIEIDKLETHLIDFFTYVGSVETNEMTRIKRGAIDFMGDIANTLFGTATQRQVDSLHARLTATETLTEQERIQINVHTHLLNVTVRRMNLLESGMEKVIAATEKARNLINEFLDRQIKLGEHSMMQDFVLSLQITIEDIARDNSNLIVGLKELINGQVTNFVLPTEMLLTILKETDKEADLIYPATVENLYKYYKLANVHFRSTNSNSLIYFYIGLPLRGYPEDLFKVFRVQPLHIPIPHTNLYMKLIGLKQVIVVSEERGLYALMSLAELDTCRRITNQYICPPVRLIKTQVKTCELRLLQNMDLYGTDCEVRVVKTYNPEFNRHQLGWIYSTPHPLDLHVTCGLDKQTHIIINGIGLIKVGRNCVAHAAHTVLPATYTDILRDTVEWYNVNLYPTQSFKSIDKLTSHLSTLDNITLETLVHNPRDMSELMAQLHTINRIEVHKLQTHIQWGWLVLIALALLMLMGVTMVTHKRQKKMRKQLYRRVEGLWKKDERVDDTEMRGWQPGNPLAEEERHQEGVRRGESELEGGVSREQPARANTRPVTDASSLPSCYVNIPSGLLSKPPLFIH